MKLQGLDEETRYRLLVAACSDLNLRKMAAEAETAKRKSQLEGNLAKGPWTVIARGQGAIPALYRSSNDALSR